MYRAIDTYTTWRHRFYRMCLLEVLSLALLCLGMVLVAAPAAYADGPGGNVTDPVVRAVDIAEPAVVRIITQGIGRLTVSFPGGQRVTFPRTVQNGANGYPFQTSGTGSFISAHGDILTADHVVSPTPDVAYQLAAQDIADYINQNLRPPQPVSATDVFNELASGQLVSTPQYAQVENIAFLSTAFSGPLNATNFQNIPLNQYARVDRIVAQTPFNTTDTAVVHVNGMDDMPMLQLGDPTGVQQQDRLTIIGFPGNGDLNNDPTGLLTLSINQIYVSAVKPNNGATVIQVGGNVEHGDSGGPALNANGQAVGIVSFGLADSGGGETSFLQTSGTARQLLQQAGINTTMSTLQQTWSKAFDDYAANIPGHWHQSMRELQQLVSQYPRFKGVNPFLQYATRQAQSETQTQENGSSPQVTGSDGLSPLPFLIGGVIVLLFLFGGLALSRRHRPAAVPPPAGYGFPAHSGYPALPPQPYSGAQPRPSQPVMIPQTPAYPGQPALPSPSPQPFYQPQPMPAQFQQQGNMPGLPAQFQQQGNMPGLPAQRPPNGLAAFGMPPVTPNAGAGNSDATLLARPQAGPQWKTWPCGHINRHDAIFCGTCGEPASAPLVRRVEQ
jgi:S1-C subfamily serine protease